MNDQLYRVPAAPELFEKIGRTKKKFLLGESLPENPTSELLDLTTFHLIASRPAKTRAHTFNRASDQRPVVTGTRKLLILLVDFSDKTAVTSQSHFSDLFFSTGTYATGSLRDYYRQVSYSKLDTTGTISGSGVTVGWYRAPHPKSYYTNNNYGFGAHPQNAQQLVEDVVALANASVNFADFDNDHDGIVDGLIVLCAGTGAEQTGNKNDIWSHAWSITPVTYDDVKVSGYFMGPEDGKIGVMCHELGHSLMGWPDLYDTDYSSRGTGNWDLMAGGSWNNGGNTPAHPTAYCKMKAGWVTPTVMFNQAGTVTIKPYETTSQVIKLPVNDAASKEYFLLSNRNKTGFDAYLPGSGLIIEHVDENKTNNTDENHYLVDIEQCDGARHLNTNANSGDAGDPFPQAGKTQFAASTTPGSKSYGGADSKIAVTNIQKVGNDISAAVSVGSVISWKTGKSVLSAFTSPHTKNAWANIQDVGWRKMQQLTADGITNMFCLLCDAQAANAKVNVYVDDSYIYQAYIA